MTLNPKAAVWLEKRGLDLEVVTRMGLYSGRHERVGDKSTVVADPQGEILVFPYFQNGIEVNDKYRAAGKKLWQREGGKKTFYNADILDDPALISGEVPLVITEGEPDCLAFLTANIPHVVSVPDGAPPARDHLGNLMPPVPQTATDIDPENDLKYGYVFNNWERLKKIKRFILATDGDEPGERLRDELARRLGRVRCSFVTYKPGSKDANALLMDHGAQAVRDLIKNAQQYPVRGIYHLRDFPDVQQPDVYSTGWRLLDTPNTAPGASTLMLSPGMFMVVLGAPGSGKSRWTLQLAANVARLHGWNVGLASFEIQPVPYVRDILRTHYVEAPAPQWSDASVAKADAWINRHFTFIHNDPRVDDDDPTLEWVIDRAADAVLRDGIRMLVVDPWNEIEHARRRDESETQYANRAIRALKRFGSSYDVMVICVIHPTKQGGLEGAGGKVSLYHADGSAAWVNKPDIGIVIERDDEKKCSYLHGLKYRFKQLGSKGTALMAYDPVTESYS